jgi:hypothetical protein
MQSPLPTDPVIDLNKRLSYNVENVHCYLVKDENKAQVTPHLFLPVLPHFPLLNALVPLPSPPLPFLLCIWRRRSVPMPAFPLAISAAVSLMLPIYPSLAASAAITLSLMIPDKTEPPYLSDLHTFVFSIGFRSTIRTALPVSKSRPVKVRKDARRP